MNKPHKGIVLVTIMMLISIIIMIAALLIVSGKNALLLGANFNEKENAYYAAECGIAYIQYCISRFQDYRSCESTLSSIYNPSFNDFTVEMVGNGCIHGILRGGASEFYVAFYDGTVKKDKNFKKLSYYSINNLSNTLSNLESKQYDGTKFTMFRTVPAQNAHIIVEGRCNKSIRYVEAMLKKDTRQLGAAFSVSAGGMEVNLSDSDSTFLVDNASGTDSKVRSLGDIKVKSGNGSNIDDKNCFKIANNGVSCTGKGTKGNSIAQYTYINGEKIDSSSKQKDYGVACDNTSQTNYMANSKLTWKDAAGNYFSESEYNGNVKNKIQNGTWIYKNSPEDLNIYKLYYYPDQFNSENAANFVNANTGYEYSKWTGDPLISGRGITVKDSVNLENLSKNGGYLFTANDSTCISSDLYGNTDFALAVFDYDTTKMTYSPSSNYRASFRVEGSGTGTDPCLVTKEGGNIYIGGELSGTGKVLCGGNVTFQGKSMLDVDKTSGVSLYSQGTVTVNPVVGTGGASDPNEVLSQAWDICARSKSNGSLDASGYYSTNVDDYNQLKKDLLSTQVPVGTDGEGNVITNSLTNVLSQQHNYNNGAVNDMVSTLLSKNTFMGTKTVTSHDESKDFGYYSNEGRLTSTTLNGYTYFVWPDLEYKKSGKDWKPIKQVGSQVYITNYDDKTKTKTWDLYYFDYTTGDVYTYFQKDVLKDNNKWCYAGANYETSYSGITYNKDSSNYLNQTNASFPTGNVSFNVKNKPINLNFSGRGWQISYNVEGKSETSKFIKMLNSASQNYIGILTNDTVLKGLIYTWGDLYAPNLQGGSLSIRGAVVAYGGNPETEDPGDNGMGKIVLNNGKNITFTYDQDYLHMLLDNKQSFNTVRVFHASF